MENFSDDDYMVQVSITAFADPGNYLWVRYTDANNGYRFKLFDDPGHCKRIHLHSFVNGEATLLDSQCYTHALPLAIKVKLSGSSIKMWAGGTLEVDLTDSDHAEGRVAFGGWGNPRFDNLRIGYDTERDKGGSVKADDDMDP